MSLLIIHTLPGSGVSVGTCIYLLPSGPYLVAFSEVFDLTVFSCFLSNFKKPVFQNIKSGKNKNQKNMVAIKAFDCVAASEVNCSLEARRSL